jgi:hypothetical protein
LRRRKSEITFAGGKDHPEPPVPIAGAAALQLHR